MARRLRSLCEDGLMLAVGFFLLWNVFVMTEAQWTFDVRGAFPAVWVALAALMLVLCRFRPGAAGWMLLLPAWMALSGAYRGEQVLAAQRMDICRAVLAFGVVLMAPRVIGAARMRRGVKAVLSLWVAALTLQAAIGLWAALTGHAVFSLKGTWYIGVNMGDQRLYLNAYVTTGAVKTGLTVVVTAVLAAMCRHRWSRVCCGVGAGVQLLCLSLTDCRTAFIAVGFAAGVMAAAGVVRCGKGHQPWRWLAAAAAVVMAVAVAYAGLTACVSALSPHVPQVTENLTWTELPLHILPHAAAEGAVQHRALDADNLFNDRQIIWKAALMLLAEEPRFLLTGTTTALAPALTNACVSPEMYPGYYFKHVHNIYLQLLTSWGLPGVVLLGLFLACFLPAAYRVMVRHELPRWQRWTPVPVLYVMACEMVDCFTRFSEESPLLLFGCLFAGLTLAADARARQAARERTPAVAQVDVIIPVYNAAGYLKRAVESALQCRQARVILVDDGSTDGSGALCDELAEDPRVTVLHQENRGAAAARNAGLDAATAAFVAFLDADDVLLPGALAALTGCIGDADAAQGSIVRKNPEIYPDLRVRTLTGHEALAEALDDPTRHLLCHGWIFRRTVLTERFDERLTLGEDGEWMLRTLRHAAAAIFTNIPAYRYTVRPDSALHGGTGIAQSCMETLTAAESTLTALDMPSHAAMYRLTHLLLMLTHDREARMETLRVQEPFAGDFRRVRLTGLSPRVLTLRLLKARAYPLVRLAVGLRRWMNLQRGAGEPGAGVEEENS